MLNRTKLGLLLSLLFAGSVWFYVQRVLIPYQVADAAAHGRPRGNLSDLYPRWLGARELLFHHRDPYSADVTREIQSGYYGRPLQPGRPGEPTDEERFAYPIYVVFLLAPTLKMPFLIVQMLYKWTLAILTMVSVLLWLRALRWRPSCSPLAILLILATGSFATVQGIKLQQLSLLVSALIAASAALLAGGQLLLAGAMLALATMKPQLVLPFAAWMLLWTFTRWRERQAFFWGFLGTLAVLVAAGEFLLPGWLGHFADAMVAYQRYTGGHSLLDELVTRNVGLLLTALFVLSTVMVGWRLRCAPINSPAFNFMLALVLAVTVVIVPMMAPYNQLLLLPAIFLIVRSGKNLWHRNSLSRFACIVTALIAAWPWLASLALMLASVVLPSVTVQKGWAIPLWTSLEIPLAILGLLAMCLRGLSKFRDTFDSTSTLKQ